MSIDYNITAFKDANGTITIGDSMTEYIQQFTNIRAEFIEQVLFKEMSMDTLELLLVKCLDEMDRRNDQP